MGGVAQQSAPAAGLEVASGRDEQLSRLWRMSREERVRAMYAGGLTLHQLCAWSSRRPHEVPTLHGEFWWIAVTDGALVD